MEHFSFGETELSYKAASVLYSFHFIVFFVTINPNIWLIGCSHKWILYEGRSINKLQNGVIILITKILKIRNIGLRFVENLALSNICEFYYDDITVASFTYRR